MCVSVGGEGAWEGVLLQCLPSDYKVESCPVML